MATGVLVDANILFPRTTRDWLFLLRNETKAGMFTVYASEDIIAETLYRLRRKSPEAPGSLIRCVHDRIVEQLDMRVDDFEVDGSFPGTDPDDAHVHAAAISSGAGILLTADTGFTRMNEDTLDELPYAVYTPDEFFVLIDDSMPNAVSQVTHQQLTYWYGREGDADLAKHLRDAGCSDFADRVARHIRVLSGLPRG